MNQEKTYAEWIEGVRHDVSPDSLSTFDHIAKIDVDNGPQLTLMYHQLFRTMTVVSFWMDNFVFPDSTDQFAARRTTSAWNLVDSGQAVGFSGTDNYRFLLPLSIKQQAVADSRLRSANGAMVDCILSCTRGIYVLDDGDQDHPLWRVILLECKKHGASALIDVAGLMAGSSNQEVAEFMTGQITHESGVVYFDVYLKAWAVYEKDNKRHVPLHSSSLAEAERFVYFDQSRCRGADMKLHTDACALVTLEPTLPKDKFMQGCARMRQLRPGGQSVILVGTSEVVTFETTPKQVLERILETTVRMIKKGLLTYFERGNNYLSFPDVVEEDITLDAMYSKRTNEHASFCDYLDATHEIESSLAGSQLVQYCKQLGQGVQMRASRLSEECEQELEMEEECEEEEDVEFPVVDPFYELDWASYQLAFTDPASLFGTGFFVPLKSLIHQDLPILSTIEWGKELVFCTNNFWKTIQDKGEHSKLDNYLRLVNIMLIVPDGRVVLVSEYEAENLLPYWWSAVKPKATLQHLCLAVSGRGFGRDIVQIPVQARTRVKLLRGYVQFSSEEKEVLVEMFRGTHARPLIDSLLSLRSRTRFFERSDLNEFALSNRLDM